MLIFDHPYCTRFIRSGHITGDKKFYLYIHYRHDKNEAFYVGIGTNSKNTNYDRALCYKKRSELWKRIARKTTYSIMIIDEDTDKQNILNKEINYIKILGKKKDKTGTLSNITDGGEGVRGFTISWTDEMRKAASERLRHRVIKDSTREKLRENIKTREFYGQSAKYVSKPIYRIDNITGEILEEFLNSVEAGKKYGISASSINAAVRKGFISMGYKWKYKDENLQKQIDEKIINKPKKERKKQVSPNSILVIGTHIEDGSEIVFSSLRSAAKHINVHHNNIKAACISGKLFNDYMWTYGNK